ncbi:ABC-F family ATP-binding cassette domain-containing protein [Tepidicaulis sp. LMO-SS28]|uniref:ABC-F family ATP-binding cassette domain-containing protein n=1 Tax=Tepidicaulis sp. LMO-SS28 TaxID=3447455 RepID=UPI003EDF3CA5
MLHINDLTYRIEGRTLLEHATAAIPKGHKVGLVGRNGTGKSTLLKLIAGEIPGEGGGISVPKGARIGMMAQEAPGGPIPLLDYVLAADEERAALMAEAETVTDPHRIAEIQTRLTDIDAHGAPSRAAAILAGLGFNEAAQAEPCSAYSGGWRMRVALAAILFSQPDVLLLDEPTNYLDLEGTVWLESYLKSYPHTVVIVSHDRDLLNRAVNGILHLEHCKLTYYAGVYDQFERERRAKLEQMMAFKKKQETQRRHMESFVERFRAKASKARQAQSRLKALAKMQPIPDIVEDRVRSFHFPSPDRPLASPIIRLEEASVGYEPGKPVLKGLDLRIDQDDRIALLGANGNGKSTFAKLLSDRLRVDSGHCYKSKKLRIAYIAQHQLDELNPALSPYETFRELMPDATQAQVRARAGFYGFGAEKADTRIENLSGGEKTRLLFAVATFGKPHLLILDEPTNHLDIDSREALVMALNEYEGAVILISHDPHLVETCADRLWIVAEGGVSRWEEDIEAYKRWLLDRNRRKGARPDDDTAANTKKESRRSSARARAELAPLKKQIAAAEKEIARLQKGVDKMDAALADPQLHQENPNKASQIAKLRADTLGQIMKLEEDWLAASEAYENARMEAEV